MLPGGALSGTARTGRMRGRRLPRGRRRLHRRGRRLRGGLQQPPAQRAGQRREVGAARHARRAAAALERLAGRWGTSHTMTNASGFHTFEVDQKAALCSSRPCNPMS